MCDDARAQCEGFGLVSMGDARGQEQREKGEVQVEGFV